MDSESQNDAKNSLVAGQNLNIVVNCKFYLSNADEENEDAEDSSPKSRTVNKSANFDANMFSPVSEFNNSQNSAEVSNRVSCGSINIDGNCLDEVFESLVMSLKKCKTRKVFCKFCDVKNEKKSCGIECNYTNIGGKTNSDNLNNDDTDDKFYRNVPLKEESVRKYGSNVNIFSVSELSGYSKDLTAESDGDGIKKCDVGIKCFHGEDMSMAEQDCIKKKFKNCYSCLTFSKDEIKRNDLCKDTISKSETDLLTSFESLNILKQSSVKDEDTVNKPVMDLVIYFESLNLLKQCNLKDRENISKSVTDLLTSFQSLKNLKPSGIKDKQTINKSVTDIVTYFENLNLSNQSSVTDKVSTNKPVTDSVISFPSTKCLKQSNAKEKQTINKSVTDLATYFENLNFFKQSKTMKSKTKSSGSKQAIKYGDRMEMNINIKSNATSSLSALQMLNISCKIGNRQTAVETTPNVMLPDVISCSRQNVPSPVSKYEIWTKGKCTDFENTENRSEDNAKKFKEHLFILPDDVLKKMEQSRNSRQYRSRLTCKNDN